MAEEVAQHPASVKVSIAGSARRFRETVRDLDLIATATDAAGAARRLLHAAVGRRGGRARRHEGDRRRPGRPPLRPPRRAAGVATATCSSTSPAPRTTTSPCARRRSGAGSRSPSTGSRRSRRARCTRSTTEKEVYAYLGYEWIPPELREDGGELEAARAGDAAGPRRAAATSAATCTRTRPGPTARTRSRRWSRERDAPRLQLLRDLRPLPPPPRRPARAADGGDRRRSGSTLPIQLLKGIEVNIRVDGTLDVRRRRARDARLGRRLRPQLASTAARPSASSRRWRTRTSTASATSPSRKIGRREPSGDRRRARDREGARDRDVPRDQLAARPARPQRRARAAAREAGLKLVIDSDGAPGLRARLRRARRRPGPPGLADEGRRAQHPHVEADREAPEEAAG